MLIFLESPGIRMIIDTLRSKDIEALLCSIPIRKYTHYSLYANLQARLVLGSLMLP